MEMEIDYGPFERVLELPSDVDPDRVEAKYRDGLLWIYLPLQLNS
jgi:HSP20 family protein